MQSVRVPKRIVEKMLRVSVVFEDLHDELEDYLIANRPHVLKKLRRARAEHLAGNTRPFVWPR